MLSSLRQEQALYWQTPDPPHVPQQELPERIQGDPAGSQAHLPVVRLQEPLQHCALLVHPPATGVELPSPHTHWLSSQYFVQHCPWLVQDCPLQLTHTSSSQTSK